MRKWNIGWGTISHCNMNCQFCYSKYRRKNSKDLGYADWVRFIDENHEKINSINYGTGENTLDEAWFDLVAYIRSHYPEIRQALTTNGHLAEAVKDEKCLNVFIESIDEVDVSLDFCDAQKHAEFRGQPKAYGWAIDTLALCKKYKKPTTIVFLGSEKNVSRENIDGLFSIAKKYGAILRMNMYRPTEGVNDFSKQFIISYETFVDALNYIASQHHIISMNDALFSSFLTNETVADPSGDRSIRILADGSITPSTYLIDENYIVANITEPNVLDKIEKNNILTNLIVKTIPSECKGCVYEKSCAGGVYDRRYLWYGTLEKKDPYCPGIFKVRNNQPIEITASDFVSVHDGYLPTIFFRPKEDCMNKYDNEFWKMLDKLFEKYDVEIDRPKGSAHPKYSDYIYPLDYGFLKGTVSSDGAGIDVWVGSSNVKCANAIISSVDFIKGDSEIKILYACTSDEIELIYNDHNRSNGMKGIMTVR